MGEEFTIERVVPEIRSICQSSKELLEIRRMSNDFAEMMGYEIPWMEFGFESLKSFLKSRPDDFWLQTNAHGEILVGVVVKEASDHIAKMVASQRDSKYVQATKLFSKFNYSRPTYCKTITKSPMRSIYAPRSNRYDNKPKSRQRRASCYISSPSKYKTTETSFNYSHSRKRERIPSPEFYKRDRKRRNEYESTSSRYSGTYDVKRTRRSSVYFDSVKSNDDIKPAVAVVSEDKPDLRNTLNKIRRRTTVFSENPAKDFNIHPEKENKKPVAIKDPRLRDDKQPTDEKPRSVSPVIQKIELKQLFMKKRRNTIFMERPSSVFNNEDVKCDTPAVEMIQRGQDEHVIKENGLKPNRWDLTPEAMVEYKKQICKINGFEKIDWDDPNNFLGSKKTIKLDCDFQKELEEYKMAKNGAIVFDYKGDSNKLNEKRFSKRTVNFWYPPIKMSLPDSASKTPEKPGYPGFAQSTPRDKTTTIHEIPSFGNISEIDHLDSSSNTRSQSRTESISTKSASRYMQSASPIETSSLSITSSSEFQSWYSRTKDTYLGWKIRNGKYDPKDYAPKLKRDYFVHKYAVSKSASIPVDTRPAEIIPEIAKELDKDCIQIKNATNSYIEYIQELQKKKEEKTEIPKPQALPNPSFKIPKIKSSQNEEDSPFSFVQNSSFCKLPRRLSISSMASDLSKISIDSKSSDGKKTRKPKSNEVKDEKQELKIKVKRTRKSKKDLEKTNSDDLMEVVELDDDQEEVNVKTEKVAKKTRKSKKALEKCSSDVSMEEVEEVEAKEVEVKEVFKIEPLKYKVAAREFDRNIVSKINMLTSNSKSAQTMIKQEKLKRHPIDFNENINFKIYKVVKNTKQSLTPESLQDLYVTIYKLALPNDFMEIIKNEPALFQIAEIEGATHISAK